VVALNFSLSWFYLEVQSGNFLRLAKEYFIEMRDVNFEMDLDIWIWGAETGS
jgi:hypothetical protein